MEDLNTITAELAQFKKEKQELELRIEELNDFIEDASTPLHKVNKYGIITWANQAELDALGYKKEEYVGLPISNFHVDPEVINDILTRLLNFENIHNYPAKLRCSNGSIKHVLINSSVFKKNGEFSHTKCFTSDVTEKINEEQRKNDFVAMVSHELKTPLTTILSYIQILLAKAQKKDDDFSTMALARTELQAKKMGAMIKDFLTLSHMESGKVNLNIASFDLHSLLEEVAGHAPFLSSIHLLKVIDCEKIYVIADRDKIGYVIMNLLSNAIKYSPSGGTITIGCKKENKKIIVYITDEGVGISEKNQTKLFERFYRVDNQKHKSVTGFGIGLYIASEFLLYHNSKIEIESKENIGSTFHFSLEAEEKSPV